MADSDLDYAKVTGRFGITVGDDSDPDELPEIIYCTSGTIEFYPLQSPVKVVNANPVPLTLGNAVIVADINADGYLEYRDVPRVWLVDLTSEKVNPRIGDDAATHEVRFVDMMAGDIAVTFPGGPVRITAAGPDGDGVNDLTTLLPVQPGAAEPIFQGPRGTSIESAAVEGGELIIGLEDGTELNAGELPVGPGGSDAGVADYITTPGTATADALSATVALRGSKVLGRLHPLARFGKVASALVRAYVIGTSISNFDNSVLKNFMAAVQATFGASQWTQFCFGVAGGDYTADYFGWKKQQYAGQQLRRLRGSSSSSPIALVFYGDFLRVEFSREADSAAATLTVDGAATGLSSSTSTSSGAQAYRQAVTWTGTKGIHVLLITPPAGAGFAYLESAEWGVTARTGVEWIDATLGGSSLANLTVLPTDPLSGSAPQIQPSGNNGLDYHFDRTDIDLYLVEHMTNDGDLAKFNAAVDYLIAKTGPRGVPVVFVTEPYTAGHPIQAAEREYLLTVAAKHNHVTVIDWAAMLSADGDDTAMKTLYYGGPTGPDYPHPTTGQAAGIAALCEAAGVRVPTTDGAASYSAVRLRRAIDRRPLTEAERLTAKTASISAVATALTAATTRARVLLTPSDTAAGSKSETVYTATPTREYVTAWQNEIRASVNTDAFGRYVDAGPLSTIGGNIAAADVNQPMKLTFRAAGDPTGGAAGQFSINLPTALRLLDDQGNVVPYTNTSTNTTLVVVQLGVGGSEAPTTITMNVKATAASTGNLHPGNGRIYAASLSATDTAILPPELVGVPLTTSVVEPVTVQASRLFNGSFGTGTLDGWTATTGTFVIEQSAVALAGKYCAHCTSGSGGTLTSDPIPVLAGDPLGVELVGRPDGASVNLSLTVTWTDHTGTTVSTSTLYSAASVNDGSGNVPFFNIHPGIAVAPPNARFATIKVTGDAAFRIQRVRILEAGEHSLIVQNTAGAAAATPVTDTVGLTLPFAGIWDVTVTGYTNGVNNGAMATYRCFYRAGATILASDPIGTSHGAGSDAPVLTLSAPSSAGVIQSTVAYSGGGTRTPVWRYRARLVSVVFP